MVGVTKGPINSVPPPDEEPATLEVGYEAQIGGGIFLVEVLNSGKCIFPDHEFANFDSFVSVSDNDGEGFLYRDLATAGS